MTCKNQAILSFCSGDTQLIWKICSLICQELNFSKTWDLCGDIVNHINFQYRINSEKTGDQVFQKIQKNIFLVYLPHFSGKNFLKKRNLTLLCTTSYGFPMLKLKKTNDPITDGWKDRQTLFPSTIPATTTGPTIFFLFFNWNSLHARLNSKYEAWSYKKNEHKKIKSYRKYVKKELTVKRCLSVLNLKPFRL